MQALLGGVVSHDEAKTTGKGYWKKTRFETYWLTSSVAFNCNWALVNST